MRNFAKWPGKSICAQRRGDPEQEPDDLLLSLLDGEMKAALHVGERILVANELRRREPGRLVSIPPSLDISKQVNDASTSPSLHITWKARAGLASGLASKYASSVMAGSMSNPS